MESGALPGATSSSGKEKHENHVNSKPAVAESSCNSCFSFSRSGRPRLPEDTLYGPVGEIVRRLTPVTEADPAAILAQLLPEGGDMPDVSEPQNLLRAAIDAARLRGRIERDSEARMLWAEIYRSLSEEPPGRLGEIISRGEAQVIRLALLFALLDSAPLIRAHHLKAALAFWSYCAASAAFIFVEHLISPKAARIWAALENSPLSMTDLHGLFGNNSTSEEIEALLAELAPRISIEPQFSLSLPAFLLKLPSQACSTDSPAAAESRCWIPSREPSLRLSFQTFGSKAQSHSVPMAISTASPATGPSKFLIPPLEPSSRFSMPVFGSPVR